jgi:CO/xanthine dehydrogenase FAD-binding subunit
MKPPVFEYFAPGAVPEIVDLLARYGADARVLAGGQSLVPIMNLRILKPTALIDLNRCTELAYIERRGDFVAIGAMTRQLDASRSSITRELCPLVAQALEKTGPLAVRSRATIGGTIAHADRVAELPCVAVALDAVMLVEGATGRREISARNFFLGDLTTAIAPSEFLIEVRFPVCPRGSFSKFSEVSIRQEGVAVVGLAVYLELEDSIVGSVAISALGVGSTPVRLVSAEANLLGSALNPSIIEAAANLASVEIFPVADQYASAAYRRHVIASMLRNALHEAARQGGK